MFDLKKVQNKGQIGIGSSVGAIIGILVVTLVMVALLPTIFGTAGLNATGFTSTAPAWLVTLLPVLVGVSMVGLVLAFIKFK